MMHKPIGAQSVAQQLLLNLRLKDTATFSNYEGDTKNVLVSRLSGADKKLWFTYIWGEKGSGKSHLLQAACRWANESDLQAAYFPLDSVESIEAIDNIAGFDLVCLDNIDMKVGSAEWDEALFHLFNEIGDRGHQLIISGLEVPARLVVGLKDLKSRLMTALPVQTARLDDDTKLRVLRNRAESRGFVLSEEVGRFIIRRSQRDLGNLMGALDDLDEQSVRHQQRLTIPFIKKVLKI